jgi:formamidopyrimidine-DNA glycosylase
MPELPEVETIARELSPLVAGQRIIKIEVRDDKLADCSLCSLEKSRILQTRRIGKQVVIDLATEKDSTSSLYLAIHLRLTGRLLWLEAHSAEPPYARVIFYLSRGRLAFCDVRRFGTLRIHRSIDTLLPKGVEPLSNGLTALRLEQLLGGTKQEIKPWLLRQDKLVGLGNIYASEVLFTARLSPFRKAGSMSRAEIQRLLKSLRKLLKAAILHCGTTFSDFQSVRGQSGEFANFLNVYRKEDQPCPRCGQPILRTVQQGRSTFYCSACQD